jgi:hypothetical protein
MILLDMYKRDPHFQQIVGELDRARIGLATTRQSRVGVEAAQTAHDKARQAYDDYIIAAGLLSELERQHAIRCKLSPREMITARQRILPDYYARAIEGAPGSMSVRDCLMTLAQRGLLDKEEPVPAGIAGEVAVVSDLQKAIAVIAQVRDGKYGAGMASALQTAAKALAKARGEEPATVIPLVDAVRTAIANKDLAAVWRAIENIAEHFGLGIDAPEPAAIQRARAKGSSASNAKTIATTGTLPRQEWMTGRKEGRRVS